MNRDQSQIYIRAESYQDFPHIHEVNTVAFGQENEANLVDLLRESDAFVPELSLLAIVNRQIVGHILFTRIKIIDTDQREFPSLALAPMAVRPAFQNQGTGSALVRYGLERARQLGYSSVIVISHPEYYPRFGFLPASKWNIKSPYDVPNPVVMAIELAEDGLHGVSGMVKYPDAFDEV